MAMPAPIRLIAARIGEAVGLEVDFVGGHRGRDRNRAEAPPESKSALASVRPGKSGSAVPPLVSDQLSAALK